MMPKPSAASASIAEMVDKAGHYLPDQAPIHAFVHHNTLHPYEHLPFKEAVRSASDAFGAAPFMDEAAYREAYSKGRILIEDIEATLKQEVTDLYGPIFEGGPMRKAWLMWRLSSLFDIPSESSIRWWLYEHNLLNKPHPLADSAARSKRSHIYEAYYREPAKGTLEQLWKRLESAAQPIREELGKVRLRDFYLHVANIDTDAWVHPMLIRLCGAYLDQGVANHVIPHRNKGFLEAFWKFVETPVLLAESWMRGLRQQARQKKSMPAEALVEAILKEMGIEESVWPQVIHDTLQSLRGWGGMFRQFELYPHKAPIHREPATLMDYLAVQLLLDLAAARRAAKVTGIQLNEYKTVHPQSSYQHAIIAYEAFVSAQAFGITIATFDDPALVEAWLSEHRRFDHFERCYLMHLGYERRHRHHILDAISEHWRLKKAKTKSEHSTPAFQTLFCMDDREESTRRHLEELSPDAETYGCPGFFGVAMQYKGLDDAVSRSLCPVVVTPRHYVEEVPLKEYGQGNYRKRRQLHGKLIARLRQSENALFSSTAWTILSGPFYSISLVIHSLAPQLAKKLHDCFTSHDAHRPATILALFRKGDEKTEDGLYRGYTIEEAADVVAGLLRSMGLINRFAPLVAAIGHGSSSLNNPHEAAYNCGATGGGRGGPNARAFAMMANHAQVRALLAQQGITIPESCVFVGGYHNTADDSIVYYDLELIPDSHSTAFANMRKALSEACMYSAQERCRRFEDAPHYIPAPEALAIAERHAMDLAQPRPEYGHATNAVCIIGRRENTKGLFFDRRAFLISYNPEHDANGALIANILQAAGPVGAGINLEYFFSRVDPHVYGCGTKLPHNISGLVGVMNGHASDLRTGLVWQMVELHEPVRLLVVVEATPERLLWVAQDRPVVGQLVGNEWVQLASCHPDSGELTVFHQGKFVPYQPEATGFPIASRSGEVFMGTRNNLGCAHITER